jgi:hypothetical protein
MNNVSKESALKFNGLLSEKSLKNVPKFQELGIEHLKDIPKPINDEHKLLAIIPEEVPMVGIDEIDPWNKVVELLNSCGKAVQNKNLDFAEIYYEQIHPFFNKLAINDQRAVLFRLQELQEGILNLRMKKVRKVLRTIC